MDLYLSLISILFSFSTIYITQKLFFKKNIIDIINKRSSHKVKATRNGGVSIFITIFVIALVFYIYGETIFDYSSLVPISLLLIVGLYDDVYEIDFKLKFIFQIIAAKIIIDSGLIIDNFHGILGINEINRILAQMFTIFIIVSIINAINFIDGIDGLAISIVSFFIISFEVLALDDSSFRSLSIIIISSFIPLYFYNYKKSEKVFLGDSGSNLLGVIVSIYVLTILSQNYFIKPEFDINKILFVVSILIYPIIDIVYVTFTRVKKGISPFKADRNHIHHILLDKINNHYKVVLVILLISLINFILIHYVFIF